jgi:hypothetical protein
MLTKLEGVNLMLDALGEDPVSSLSSGLPDAETAERFLDRVTMEVLAKGWSSNTDYEYTMARDADTRVPLSSDVLRVTTTGSDKWIKCSIRYLTGSRYLYDNTNERFTWTRSPEVNVVWNVDFAELPFELQSYIAYTAARKFQESELGSVALDSFVVRGQTEAWSALQDFEAEQENLNILDESPHCHFITYRAQKPY